MKNISVFCFLPLVVVSQKKFTYSVNYTPGISYGIPKKDYYLTRNTTRSSLFTQGCEINIGYQINKSLTVTSGLGYQDLGESLRYLVTFGELIDPQVGFTGGPSELIYHNHYHFLSLPALVSYNFSLNEKLAMAAELGARGYYFLTGNSVVKQGDEINRYQISNQFTRIPTLSVGLQSGVYFKHTIFKNLYYKVGPSFEMFVTSVDRGFGDQYPYKLSMRLGVGF